MQTLRFLALVAIAGAAAGPVTAQVSVGAAGVYASLNGTDFNATDAGFGLDAQVRFPLGATASIGFGGQRTSHGLRGALNNVAVTGVFAEPRLTLQTAASVKAYLLARGGYLHESYSEPGFDAKANGYYVGGGAGLLIAARPRVAVDLSILFGSVSFGEATINGSKVSNSSVNGTAIVLRAGILFGLGK
jgi:hypothetical protein